MQERDCVPRDRLESARLVLVRCRCELAEADHQGHLLRAMQLKNNTHEVKHTNQSLGLLPLKEPCLCFYACENHWKPKRTV
jgi:hypothetical protein